MSVSQVIMNFDTLSSMERGIEANDENSKVKLLAKKIKQNFGVQLNRIIDPENEYTAVKLAAKRGNLVLVKALLAAGADENQGNPDCTLESLYQKFVAREAEKEWEREMADSEEEPLEPVANERKDKKQKTVIEGDPTCIICMVEERTHAPAPCYHLQYCLHCLEKIFKDIGKCAVCCEKITSIVKVFV